MCLSACAQGLLNEAVYIMQQEILVAQLFGQPAPTLRLADSADRAPPPSGPLPSAEWEEPVPRSSLASRSARPVANSDSDSDSDGGVSGVPGAVVGLLPLPKARASQSRRRRPPDGKKRDQASKQSRRPRPGGPSRRAAGPPYREDPVGPAPQPEPEPEPEPEPGPQPQPKPKPKPRRSHPLALGACSVCGDVARACTCASSPLPPSDTASEARAVAPRKGPFKQKTKTGGKTEPPLAIASSEYDYAAPSGAYLSLSVGCEVSHGYRCLSQQGPWYRINLFCVILRMLRSLHKIVRTAPQVIVTGRHDDDWL